MGWWGYHTNAGDYTQDEICEMTDKLRISNYGFGERLDKIGKAVEDKIQESKEPKEEQKEESKNSASYSEEESFSENNSADEEEKAYIQTIKNSVKANKKSSEQKGADISEQILMSEDSGDHSSEETEPNEDGSNDSSWWAKRYEIETYVKKNINTLSEATFLVAGIAWELYERSKCTKLPEDFPEDLRLMALESAKAYYEEMKIALSSDPTICRDGNKCLRDLQLEIDIFSRK